MVEMGLVGTGPQGEVLGVYRFSTEGVSNAMIQYNVMVCVRLYLSRSCSGVVELTHVSSQECVRDEAELSLTQRIHGFSSLCGACGANADDQSETANNASTRCAAGSKAGTVARNVFMLVRAILGRVGNWSTRLKWKMAALVMMINNIGGMIMNGGHDPIASFPLR